MSLNLERWIKSNPFEKSFFKQDDHQFVKPLEDGEIFLSLPYSDLSGWVYSNEDIWKAHENFSENLYRLSKIKSLSYLAYIDSDIKVENQYLYRLTHERCNHTFVVVGTGTAILKNNNINDSEIKKYNFGAFYHDMATPALGDATKFLDVKNLHEEKFWQEMLNDDSVKYLDSINTTQEEIDKIITNEGILGQVLDIADRITYVCQDLSNIVPSPDTTQSIEICKNSLSKFIHYNPQIGNIYQDVKIDSKSNQVYFENPDRLHAFLYIRAMLHNKVYMHPVNQGRDLVVASHIRPFYTIDSTLAQKHDLLTPQRLRQMDDDNLIIYLASKNYKSFYDLERTLNTWYPRYYPKFKTLEVAEKLQSELKLTNQFNIIGIKEIKGFNPSTKYKVLDKDKKRVVEYREYNPKGAEVIEKIAQKTKGFCVYYENKTRQNLD